MYDPRQVILHSALPPTRFFINRMLDTCRDCLAVEVVMLSPDLHKDLNWFYAHFLYTNGVFIIHEDDRSPITLYVDACSMGSFFVRIKPTMPSFPSTSLMSRIPFAI